MSELKLSFGNIVKFPDPSNIQTAGEWYLLNHVSSPLLAFDHEKNRFVPLLGESWSIEDRTYKFRLKNDIHFSDGSPIRSKDFVSSIKRLILKKTSSHFPIWEYIKDCKNLRNLSSDCRGIQIIDERTVQFELTERRESFLLQMASPEGGIWSQDDIDPTTLELHPKKFSGSYSVIESHAGTFRLSKNGFSPIHKDFPFSPAKVTVFALSRANIEEQLLQGKIDLFIGDVIPFNNHSWNDLPVKMHFSTPSSVLYLFGLGDGVKKEAKIGRKFFETLWGENKHSELYPADTFLPFGSIGAINRSEFLSQLPEKGISKVKIAAPDIYFQKEFIDLLKKTASRSGVSFEITQLPVKKYFELFSPHRHSEFDFALSTYVASERYPAVQLRYMLNGRVLPQGVNFPAIDSPETSEERFRSLAAFQSELLSRQMVLPLFFVRTHIVYQRNLDLGNQPVSDADIQLWRVKVNSHE